MKYPRLSLSTLLGCLALTAFADASNSTPDNVPSASPATAQAQGIAVSFAPQEGARYLKRVHIQSSTEINDQALSLSDVRADFQEQWQRPEGKWQLQITPTAVNVSDTSGELSVTLQTILLETPYTIVFDDAGKAVEALGLDALETRLKEALPQDAHPQALGLLNAETQRTRIIRNWNTLLGWLPGKSWRAGEKNRSEFTEASAPRMPSLSFEQDASITAASNRILLIAFTGTGRAQSNAWGSSPITVEESGTLSVLPASGQPLQLQKTRQMQMHTLSEGNQVITQKRTEVTTITWSLIAD